MEIAHLFNIRCKSLPSYSMRIGIQGAISHQPPCRTKTTMPMPMPPPQAITIKVIYRFRFRAHVRGGRPMGGLLPCPWGAPLYKDIYSYITIVLGCLSALLVTGHEGGMRGWMILVSFVFGWCHNQYQCAYENVLCCPKCLSAWPAHFLVVAIKIYKNNVSIRHGWVSWVSKEMLSIKRDERNVSENIMISLRKRNRWHCGGMMGKAFKFVGTSHHRSSG